VGFISVVTVPFFCWYLPGAGAPQLVPTEALVEFYNWLKGKSAPGRFLLFAALYYCLAVCRAGIGQIQTLGGKRKP
jgi:hypothetical protein